MRRACRLRFQFPFPRFVRPRIRLCPFPCGSMHRWAGLPALSAGFPCLPNQNGSGKSAFFSHYGGGPARAFHPFPYSSESVHDSTFRHPTAVFQQILAYYTTFVLI